MLSATLLATSCVPDPGPAQRADAEFLRLAAAEDARPSGGRDLALLLEAATGEVTDLRRVAIRALGRLEDPAVLSHVAAGLVDPAPAVRAEAANAVAQTLFGQPGDEGLALLLPRVGPERDPQVRAALARSIGRLTLTPSSRADAAAALIDLTRIGDERVPQETLLGVALGIESHVRAAPGRGIGASMAETLLELSRVTGRHYADVEAARIRGLAVSALGQARRMDVDLFDRALRDDDPQVGAIAMRFFDQIPPASRPELLRRAVGNASPFTVVEALRYMDREPRDESSCTYLLGAAAGPPPQIAAAIPPGIQLTAIDALARPCPDPDRQRALLVGLARNVSAGPDWRFGAHALVSLARLAPDDARPLVVGASTHADPFVRAYAAQAARFAGALETLGSLAADADPNVRTAAIQGLTALVGHRADDVLRDQLAADDPQLVLTAAGLLEGTPDPSATAEAALAAFVRMSEARRETWRDPRMALLGLLRATGDASSSAELEPFLLDYDERVAYEVAATLEAWNGRPYTASPRPLPRLPLPTVAELRAMDGARVRLHMEGGGAFDIELHSRQAVTNTFRFFRMASEGAFDGLTFHRWAPNFVIQGGSPGANEYQGDGPYSRDEVGLASHWRGTVGISTRGRDTGDGQIFVNLMDNVRLDHAYTIIGTVVEGMETVDRVLEGAVIVRAEVLPGS